MLLSNTTYDRLKFLAIYDDHFSVDEKVETYRVYRKHGGNHDAKKYMTNLLGEDADVYLATHTE